MQGNDEVNRKLSEQVKQLQKTAQLEEEKETDRLMQVENYVNELANDAANDVETNGYQLKVQQLKNQIEKLEEEKIELLFGGNVLLSDLGRSRGDLEKIPLLEEKIKKLEGKLLQIEVLEHALKQAKKQIHDQAVKDFKAKKRENADLIRALDHRDSLAKQLADLCQQHHSLVKKAKKDINTAYNLGLVGDQAEYGQELRNEAQKIESDRSQLGAKKADLIAEKKRLDQRECELTDKELFLHSSQQKNEEIARKRSEELSNQETQLSYQQAAIEADLALRQQQLANQMINLQNEAQRLEDEKKNPKKDDT